ncbi:WEE/WEE-UNCLASSIFIED protein kinase [Cladophialophora psammophila CBS 110553]|uniref:WEE/WEE-UNCLASSIFIED protein kinase n=1 Tax=Cladophialophora psammophila CBS 110553 TaxID=1182543 RepID=W9X2V8_9EURO|nr:WEE/WEE-UNCLASSIFIED protein kinase [Cladophialophora psammophila CBS 110553]EXJ74518.1 WEE/WEE-UNCLASSIFIED protein kinase [Cladophialophora psammophila CBS 110553]
MATYSPHREEHSPKSAFSRFDPHSAIREIRRSLSRSPSKSTDFRQQSLRSPGPGNLPFSPSPLSPSRNTTSENFLHLGNMASHPNRTASASRFSRPSLRRTNQSHGVTRLRTSPRSPTKRVLTDSNDGGNSSPMPLRKRSSAEAERELALKCLTAGEEKENDKSPNEPLSWKSVHTRQEKRRSGGMLITAVAPLSPMKRSDCPRSDETPGCESPSAKRRSLHGPGLDFSIFESDSLDSGMFGDKRAQDDNDWFVGNSFLSSSRFSTIPKRSSSLRKSTIQQRQIDRSSNLKLYHATEADKSWLDFTPAANPKKEMRMSLDNHINAFPRDSPFPSQGNLLSASIHPMTATGNGSSYQPRHPLSRTVTQSLSQPDEQDDSPTHGPIHRPSRPRSHDFSKSLPVGSSRPVPSSEDNEFSSQTSFATPGNYKAARPLPAAFMSTGLISKKNRNVEDPNAGLPKAHMPDTPCKKQPAIFQNEEKFAPAKSAINRISRQSFGVPASPLEMSHGASKVSAFPFSKSLGIFGVRSSRHNLLRDGSFASIDPEDKVTRRSPLSRANSQSTDSDYPPTPTKHLTEPQDRGSVSPSPHQSALSANQAIAPSTHITRLSSSKLSPISASLGCVDLDSDSAMEDSPSANLRPKSALNVVSLPSPSFANGRASKSLRFPTPSARKTHSIPTMHCPALERAKIMSVPPVSPRIEKTDRGSPHTPLDSFFPPDPSGLTISGRAERPPTRQNNMAPIIPATPTGPREYFPNFSNRPSLNLASSDATNIDSSLTSRFDKVDLIGSGEFSQVYRVSQPPETSPYHKVYSVSTSRPSSRSSVPEKVWAVKRSRYPYAGTRDRQRKIHEVDVLKALGHSDHIVTFVDSWEENSHLYIQTEFCEEGTLDVFLAQIGLKARLDDFRIWKILLELAMGLKHIHDSGFIHLDLKPANVLITFEGVLKIADFGMATRWPAKAGIEGEGDREYIGPEILMGRYDKPADIFALGLIMLETAGNVELPDNGVSWQKLRNGDLSDVPSLTWSSGTSGILRDASGNPVPRENSFEFRQDSHHDDVEVMYGDDSGAAVAEPARKASRFERSGELVDPPQFMVDPSHEQALDRVVRWMISPDPNDRPLASEVLSTEGVRWAETRRRAGATIFEGNWGPADEVLAEDAEMIDV